MTDRQAKTIALQIVQRWQQEHKIKIRRRFNDDAIPYGGPMTATEVMMRRNQGRSWQQEIEERAAELAYVQALLEASPRYIAPAHWGPEPCSAVHPPCK
jgi:hypothetical protein